MDERRKRTSCGHVRIRDEDRLNARHNLLALDLAVRLHDGETKWSGPNHTGHLLLRNLLCRDLRLHRLIILYFLLAGLFFELGSRRGSIHCLREAIRRDGLGDYTRYEVKPGLNVLRATEEISNTREDLLRKVRRRNPNILFGNFAARAKLTLDLVTSTNEGDAIHGRHDGLLNDFAGDTALQHLCVLVAFELVALLNVSLDLILDHVCHEGVHIGWSVCNSEVNLLGALRVSPESGVVLQAVAGTILMHGKRRLEFERLAGLEGCVELHTSRQTLPGVVCLHPPSLSLA